MELDEMAKTLVERLHLETNPVGVKLLKKDDEIPKGVKMITEPCRYCEMVQAARFKGETSLAKVDMHSCKGGAAGLGLMEFPENIASGNLYFSKLNKCETKEAGSKTVSSFPAMPAGSAVATLVAPLEKMSVKPDVVIFVGTPVQARRIVQAVLYEKGGRVNIDTAGIQSFCVDATSSPILKGNVNVSLGCDGSAKNSGLENELVVVGIPFDVAEKASAVLAEKGKVWDDWMKS